MRRYLNFVCPTDCLESVIADAVSGEHFFISSLGNSVVFDQSMMQQIKELLETEKLSGISFLLADDNRFVLDALGEQNFWELKGLEDFYDQITREKEYSEELWQMYDNQFLILSNYLNAKIRLLKENLHRLGLVQTDIRAKIYKRQEGMFRQIYPDVMMREYVSLN